MAAIADQMSQNTATQMPSATGSAKIRPRENDLFGVDCREIGVSIRSSGKTLLSFCAGLIPLCASLRQPGVIRRRASSTAGSRGRPASHRRSIEALGLLALLPCLAFDARKARASGPGTIFVPSGRPQHRLRNRILAIKAALGLACSLPSSPGAAQEAKAIKPVDLFDPEAGTGIRLGPGLALYPDVASQVSYDSNIYNLETTKRADGVLILRPNLRLATDLPRHGFEVTGSSEIRRYFQTASENSEQYDLRGLARFDLGERIELVSSAGYARRIELRGLAGDQFQTDSPVSFHEKSARLRLARTGGRLELAINGQLVQTRFDDAALNGLSIDMSNRDVTFRNASVRADLRMSQRFRIFADVSGNEVVYRKSTGTPRDSSGYAILVGAKLQITQLVDIEVAAGFINQTFENKAIPASRGVNYRVVATWTPSPLWQIEANAGRTVDAGPREEVAAIIRSDFKLRGTRVLSDRWRIEAEVARTTETYKGMPRTDRRYSADASIHYRLADRIGVFAQVGYRDQDGGALSRKYDGFAASVGARVVL